MFIAYTIFRVVYFFCHSHVSFVSPRAGENVVPEPAHEAQEAAAEGAGRAEASRGPGELRRERRERQGTRGGAEARTGRGLVRAGGERRRGRRRRRRGHRGRRLLPGSPTIVGCRVRFTLYMYCT